MLFEELLASFLRHRFASLKVLVVVEPLCVRFEPTWEELRRAWFLGIVKVKLVEFVGSVFEVVGRISFRIFVAIQPIYAVFDDSAGG